MIMMKRYDIVDRGYDHYEIGPDPVGDYVLHSDALAAIETARKEERANIVGWLREFTDDHAHTPHDFAQWIESGYHTRAPTGDEND